MSHPEKPDWPAPSAWKVDIIDGSAAAEMSDGAIIEVRRAGATKYDCWYDGSERIETDTELLNLFEAIEYWKRWWDTE